MNELKLKLIDEITSSITHIIGVALSITGLVLMLMCNDCDVWQIVSYSIFGSSLIILYFSSALYHGMAKLRLKVKLNKLDHAAIYILIAGTYTPYTLVTLRGAWGWTLFGVIWGLAIFGVIYKLFFYSKKFRTISAIVYVLMGWMFIIAIKPILSNLPFGGLLWLLAGGVSYSLGVIFYLWKKLPMSHTIWHLFVLGGSICHFFSIYLYV